MIAAAFRAEWFKAVRRPAVLITVGLLFVAVLGLGYLTAWLVATHLPAGGARGRFSEINRVTLLNGVYPASLVRKALSAGSGLFGIFSILVGVQLQGSEYAWGTVKTSLTQLPGRLTILAGRLLALAALVAMMAVGVFGLSAIASLFFALADGAPISYPSAFDLLKGVAALWLISGFWASIGFGLSTVFRQTGLAIGIGLGYGILIENLVFSLLIGLGDSVKQIHTYFPVANVGYLVQAFGPTTGALGGVIQSGAPDAEGLHAVILLVLWTAALLGTSAILVQRRDVL